MSIILLTASIWSTLHCGNWAHTRDRARDAVLYHFLTRFCGVCFQLLEKKKLFKSYEVVYSAPSDEWVYKVCGPMTRLTTNAGFVLSDVVSRLTELKSRLWFSSSNTCISDALTVNVPWYTNADPKPKNCNHWLTFLENAAHEELNHTMHGPRTYSS